jgi:hypothetical protein
MKLGGPALLLTLVVLGCGSAGSAGSPGGGVTLAPVEDAATPTPKAPAAPADPPREFIPGYGALAVGLTAPAILRERPDGPVVARVRQQTEFGSPMIFPVVQRRGRWVAVVAPQLANGHHAWLRLGPRAELFRPGWSVTIDLSDRSLIARRAGKAVRTMAVGVGRAGTPTPQGLFGVTDKLVVRNGISPYGYGALALSAHQPQVPQGWGGGDRIAVHGTQSPSTVGQAASLGCLRVARDDVMWLVHRVPLGTPVRIKA